MVSTLTQLDQDTVKWVQAQLVKAQLLKPSDVDGIVGKRTLAAYAEFKRKNYLQYPLLYGASTEIALKELDSTDRPVPVEALGVSNSTVATFKGSYITLPHGMGKLYLDEPVNGCKHIKWKELTANGTRIPDSKLIVSNLIKISRQLEKARKFLGDRPITVTSGFRPPQINRQVGGVTNSRHLLGDAVDIKVQGVPAMVVANRLNGFWGTFGGIGFHTDFTHLDGRGYQARFSYGR